MIYSLLLSGQGILTGRPGGESIEAGKRKSSPLSLQIYSSLFSLDDLFYYINYQIQNTESPTCESCLASFGITDILSLTVKRNSKATSETMMKDV